MKRYDEMTKEEIDQASDGEMLIARIKTELHECQQDLHNLYRVKDWTDSTHDAQQRLYRQIEDYHKELEQAIWAEIKSYNGCIHLEIATIKRELDNNSKASQMAIINIERFAKKITELMQ